MNRRIPILSTLIVIAAVAVMVRLGFWQLDRLQEKTALITRYEGAASNPALVRTWELEQDFTPYLYRRTSYHCAKVAGWSAIAGTNDRGQPGIAHIASCFVYDGPVPLEDRLQTTDVVVGWSQSPAQPLWAGGDVSGIVAPAGKRGYKVVIDPPIAGLTANARPDPNTTPNNHFAYAIQWFLFAGVAAVIYGIAVWKRMRST